MRKKIVLLILILVSVTAFGENKKNKEEQIIDNLRELESIYLQYLDRSDRREAKALMKETIEMIKEMNQEEESKVMADDTYTMIYKEVSETLSDREKTETISASLADSELTSKQFIGLLKLYTFDNYKEECIYQIYPKIADKENAITFISVITSPFSKEKIKKFIESNGKDVQED